MRNLPNHKKTNRFFGNKGVIIIGLFILIFLSVALGKELLRRYEVNKEIAQLEKEIATLEKENIDINDLMNYFNTNSYIEKEARQKLGLQKEGETMVILPKEGDNQESSNTTSEEEEEVNQTNLQRWWNYFFQIK